MKLYVITYSERDEDPYGKEYEHSITAANEYVAVLSFKEISGNHCRILGVREV